MATHRAGDGDQSTSERNSYRRAADPNYTPRHAANEPQQQAPTGDTTPDQQGQTYRR